MSDAIINKLKNFHRLVKSTISPESQLVLFGSYAKGKNKRWSDIDVAVILPKVKDRLKTEVDLKIRSLSIDERINPFVFSIAEYQENSPLIWEIKKYGKKI